MTAAVAMNTDSTMSQHNTGSIGKYHAAKIGELREVRLHVRAVKYNCRHHRQGEKPVTF